MVSKRYQAAPLTKTSGHGNPGTTVTVHETANTSKGANAAAHANMQSRGNVRNASWQWSVDDKEAVQSFYHNIKCWHAGTAAGNNTSIGVEICVNSDGDFTKAVSNAAELVADILREKGAGVESIRQHEDWSGKDCPNFLREGSKGPTWDGFIAQVASLLSGEPASGGGNPAPPSDGKPRNRDGSITIAQDGIRGPATISRWQEVMATPIDGKISKGKGGSTLIKADQQFLNSVVAAGHIRNLTGKDQLDVDGIEGANTVKVRQFWLANAMNVQHQINLIGHPLGIDGILGKDTNTVHQFALNNATTGTKSYGRI